MTIQEWLKSDKDFAIGVALYTKYGANINLKRFFARPKTKFSEDKLLYELQQIAGTNTTETVTVKPSDFVKHTPIAKPKINRALLPQQYQALDVKKGRLYNMAQYLKAQLDNAATQEVRLELALKIVKTWREIDAIWEKLDYWNEHGQMMPENAKAVIDLDTATESEMIKHRNNLRSHISKLKKRPKRINDLLQKQKELETVTQKLIDKYGVG